MNMYKKIIDFNSIKNNFKKFDSISNELLEGLYLHVSLTLIALFIIGLVLVYLLLPDIGNILYVWFAITTLLIISRLYDSYRFFKKQKLYPLVFWYKQFIIKAWLTAFLFSAMMLYVIPQLDAYHRLLVLTVALGISGGAVSSLSTDPRTALGYISILLLPISFEIMFFAGSDGLIFAILLILYFFTLVGVIVQASSQRKLIDIQSRELLKVEQELNKKNELLSFLFKQAPIGIFTYDMDYVITDCNRSFLELFEQKREVLVGLDLTKIPDKSPLHMLKKALLDGTQIYVGPYVSMKGIKLWVEAKISPIFDNQHHVIGGMVLIENKTKEHNALEELEYSAQHDPMTRLLNRRGFHRFMKAMVKEEKHKQFYSALFYLDLNQFKQINDSLGHAMGDNLLIAIAKRLEKRLDDPKSITRLGGDEFIVVVPFIDTNIEKAKKMIDEYAQKIQSLFDDPFIIDKVRLHMKCSIGIVVVEPGFSNVDEIVRYADISMYQAKRLGVNYISYYSIELDEERKRQFDLQHQLVSALKEDGLEMSYQPIVRISDDSLYAAEALIRWDHPTEGMISAERFIPLAVESGIVVDIGWWVLEQVCRQIRSWKENDLWNLSYISININAKQLLMADFREKFLSKLKSYGVENSEIKIEITETSLIDNFDLTQEIILSLQEKGIRCAIDDFGTGYSSLSYLKKLSFSILKIDRDFMHGLENDAENIKLVSTIIKIGKQFKYDIVIEGIETAEQREIMKKIDDTLYYQGYLFSPSVPGTLFEKKFLA